MVTGSPIPMVTGAGIDSSTSGDSFRASETTLVSTSLIGVFHKDTT